MVPAVLVVPAALALPVRPPCRGPAASEGLGLPVVPVAAAAPAGAAAPVRAPAVPAGPAGWAEPVVPAVQARPGQSIRPAVTVVLVGSVGSAVLQELGASALRRALRVWLVMAGLVAWAVPVGLVAWVWMPACLALKAGAARVVVLAVSVVPAGLRGQARAVRRVLVVSVVMGGSAALAAAALRVRPVPMRC
jgi:hypothetical protein